MSLRSALRSVTQPGDSAESTSLGAITGLVEVDDGLEIEHEGGKQRLQFLNDEVLEVRVTNYSLEEKASLALDPGARWPGPFSLDIQASKDTVELRSGRMAVRIDRSTGALRALTLDGRVIQEDAEPPSWRHLAGIEGAPPHSTVLSKRLRTGERLFGLGDKAKGFDRAGERYVHWNTDAFGFDRHSDPLYKTIPFVVAMGLNGEISHGLFVDSFARSTFDLGAADPRRLTVEAESEDVTYYCIFGETPLDVVRHYARLTGKTPMLPRWALGYHQCRYSYRTEAEMREVAAQFRSRRIPCDTLYFDIHYMDGFRVFTWDREAFPDPSALIRDLKKAGFTTVAIVDPGIRIDSDYAVHRDGIQRGVFVRSADSSRYEGVVWPGLCHFPDFPRADVREWWGEHLATLLDDGIDGIWCDMNEPSVFVKETGKKPPRPQRTMPDNVQHELDDGRRLPHRQLHNAYGMQMQRATFDAMRRHRPDKRPFTITRAAYAGSQRFGTCWTGDNSSTWQHLRLAIEQCLSLSVSGMGFCGTDVGGFSETPSGELLARWTQVGALTPLFRNHSSVDTPRQEPWLSGEEVERICREAIELRYRLLPYLYTLLQEMATRGTPIMRPLPLVHPADPVFQGDDPFGFYLGDALLCYPVIKRKQRTKTIYLPGDEPWYDFHTGEVMTTGHHTVETPLDHIPLFVKAGTVLPLGPIVQSTAEIRDQPLELHVYPRLGVIGGSVYDDAGDGPEYLDDGYFHGVFVGAASDAGLRIDVEVNGSFQPRWSEWRWKVFGEVRPARVMAHGAAVDFEFDGMVTRFTTVPGSAINLEAAR